MAVRLYVPALGEAPDIVMLTDEQAHHVAHVMRARVGDLVRLFDGRGREYSGALASLVRGSASVRVHERVASAPESLVAFTLVQAVLKGDQMDRVVSEATMAGVSRISPVLTQHTAVARRAFAGDKPLTRWERIAAAAASQSGRAVVPVIDAPRPLDAAIVGPALALLLVEPSTGVGRRIDLTTLAGTARERGATLIIGPEGGWDSGERERLEAAGARPWTLGPTTLRAESVALVALSILRYAWD